MWSKSFQWLDTRPWKAVKPEDGKEEMIPVTMITQITAVIRVSQPWIQEGNGTQVEPSTIPEWRKQSWDSEKTKWIEFAEQSTWGVRTTRKKNSRDVQRVPLEYLTEYWSAQANVETTWSWRKNHPKEWGVTMSNTPMGLGRVPVLLRQTGKPHDSWAWDSTWKGLALKGGIIRLTMNTDAVPPNILKSKNQKNQIPPK